jgi:tetratricopeptide (TPR) repeat protein
MKTISTTRKNKKAATARRKQKTRQRTDNGLLYLTAAALVMAVFICYANSMGNDFVFDDQYLVLIYSRPRSFSHLLEMLIDSYRPVRNLSYILDFAVWGANPFGFHLTNVLIHAANTVLVFFLIRRFTVSSIIPALTALIFAVHPIQTDAVAYISGRRDVLFTLFYLAAFHSYLTYRNSKSRLSFALFLVLWALGLMSKEMAVSLPLVIFIWNFCEFWPEEEGNWTKRYFGAARKAFNRDRWLYIALTVAAIAFTWYMLFIRYASGRAGKEGLHYWGDSLFATVLTVIKVHAWYLKQLIYPTPIAQYFGAFDVSTSLFDLRVLVSLAVVTATVAAGFAMLKRNRLMAFAILSYFAMLLPVSQIIPHHELLADHYLYLPMMGFGLLVASLVREFATRTGQARQIAYAAVTVFIIALAVMTVIRNRDWKDEFSVWQANYKAVPESPRASYNLGGLNIRRDPRRAETLLKESLASDPSFEPAYLSLARLYVIEKRTAEAEALISQGIALTDAETRSYILRNPSLLKSQFTTTLAAARWEEGDKQATEQLLQQAIAIYPPNAGAHEALANLYHDQDRVKEEDALKQSLAVVSDVYDLQARLASLLVEAKKYDEALGHLQQMLALDPNESECRKARPYLATAKAAAPNTFEQKAISETLVSLERQCAGR